MIVLKIFRPGVVQSLVTSDRLHLTDSKSIHRHVPLGEAPGRPRTCWRGDVSVVCERLGIPSEELENVCMDRDVSASLLGMLPLLPIPG